jgi:anti-sigma B factor antagonist
MAGLRIAVEARGDVTAVVLAGELDMAEADRLAGELLHVQLQRPRAILIDLSELNFLDSHGLAVLLDAADQCAALGCRLLVVRPPEPIMQIFRITMLDRRFEWAESGQELEALS